MELTVADSELLHAAQDNDIEKVKKLRRTCPNMDVCTHGTQSRTALHIAVMRNHFEVVKALLVRYCRMCYLTSSLTYSQTHTITITTDRYQAMRDTVTYCPS